MEPEDATTIVEESSFAITATTGLVSTSTGMSLNNLTAFAAQFLQIYDEWRLLKVQHRYHSRSATSSGGAFVMYLERDIADAAETTLAGGYRQQEAQSFRPYEDFVSAPKLTTLEWNPKDPSDFEFQKSSSTAIYNIVMVGEGLSTTAPNIGTIQTVARIQFRGRNPSA